MQNKSLKQYFFLSFIFFSSCLFSQSQKLNLIILNDKEISKSIFDFKITPINDNSLNESVIGKYVPGDLIIDSKDFDRLLMSDSKDFEISFTVISTINPNLVKEFKYNIMIPKTYLNYDYLIINIFNMYNENSRKKYSKLIKNNKEYYVVIETPNSMKFD